MDVIAEGIEAAQHVEVLKELKCDYGQGFYYSAPLDSAGAEKLLVEDRRWA